MNRFADIWSIAVAVWPVLVLSCAAGCEPARTGPAPVVILAAASTMDLLTAVIAAAPPLKAPSATIQISTGPSQALAQQVLAGASADIYISANQAWADEVTQAGLAEKSVPWLSNQLVLVAPHNSEIADLNDLLLPSIKRIAIAGEGVPAGIYAEQVLRYHGLWKDVTSAGKVVRGHDVRGTLAYAIRGEVDAAVVYASDAQITSSVKIVARFDPASHEPIVYPLIRVRSRGPSPAADQLFQWLQSDAAMVLAKQHGFAPVRQTVQGE